MLNDVKINVTRYQEKAVDDPKSGSPLQYITIDFQVRSGEEYHKITTLLYEQIFDVKIPERNRQFEVPSSITRLPLQTFI